MRRKIFLLLLLILLGLPQAASAQLGRWETEEEGAFKDDVRSGRFRPFIEANWASPNRVSRDSAAVSPPWARRN